MAERFLGFIEKLLVVFVALGVVAYFVIAFYRWAQPLKDWFLSTGDLENFIVLSAMLFVIVFVLRKLLIWQVRTTFRRKPRRRGHN